MKVSMRSQIPPRPQKPKPTKRKRGKPLPDWLIGVILLGGLLIIGAIFAVRLSHVGYEGPDKYPEFRELKKAAQKERELAAAKAEEAAKAEAAKAAKSLDSASTAGSAAGKAEQPGK